MILAKQPSIEDGESQREFMVVSLASLAGG